MCEQSEPQSHQTELDPVKKLIDPQFPAGRFVASDRLEAIR